MDAADNLSLRRISLARGNAGLLRGPASFRVATGAARSLAAPLQTSRLYRVPEGEALPLEATESVEIELRGGDAEGIRVLPRAAPASWEEAAARALKESPGTLWISSEAPSARAAFGRYLANRLFTERRRVSIVDAELDASMVGPPGCVGALSLNDPVLLFQEEAPTAIQYVGSLSRNLHFLPSLLRLAKKVRTLKNPEHLLILLPEGVGDSILSGGAPLEVLRPDMVVSVGPKEPASALSSAHIQWAETFVEEFGVAEEVGRARRERIFRRYYKDRRFLLLPFHHVATDRAVFLSGKECRPPHPKVMYAENVSDGKKMWVAVKEPLSRGESEELRRWAGSSKIHRVLAGEEAGLQVGLADENGDTLALGLVQRFDYAERHIEIWTPLAIGKENRVKVLQFGSLRLALSGEEREPAEAGYF